MGALFKITVFLSSFIVILTRCKAQEIFSLRVVNSTSSTTSLGRLEVYYKNQWGCICAEGWDFLDALVACRQIGYRWVNYQGLEGDKEGRRGDAPTWLSNVACVGSERSLEKCSNDGWMNHECSGSSATVWCTNAASNIEVQFFSYIGFATEGNLLIRPYPGSVPYLVCDKGWDQAEANVICRQKGFPSASRATTGSYFGEHPPRLGQLKYMAAGLECQGVESSIGECHADMWFTEQCLPGHEAGVVCNRREEPAGFQVRLVNGKNRHEGLLEIFYKGRWVTIYIESGEDYFYRTGLFSVGTVACRQLGFGYLIDVTTDDRFGEVTVPITIENMRCSRDEESLAQCEFVDMDADGSPATSAPIGFICSGPLPEGKHPIRFAYPGVHRGSQSGRSTYLEIFHNNKWGTICNTGWTRENSLVACRELGYSELWYGGNGLGSGGSGYKGPILQEGITCKGDEETLDQCELGTWYQHQCSHERDVYLGCSKSIDAELSTKQALPTTANAAIHNQGHASPWFVLLSLIFLIFQEEVNSW